MRATSMRRLAGTAGALLLIGTTVLTSAGAVLAAVPNATATSEALPAQFSAGNNAGFRGRYEFQDGSTLARLYLRIDVTGADSNVYLSVTRNGNAVACARAIPVECSFKGVRFGEVILATAAFAPTAGATAVSATYRWSTTGSTGSDGGTSHGDTWPNPLVTRTSNLSTDSNYAGGFNITSNGTVANLQVVSASNPQATRLAGLPAGVRATVLDGAGASGSCTPNADVDCTALIGEWSEVTVGDGQSFGTAFTIVITFDSGTPRGFVHSYLDANGDLQQELVGPCAKKNPTYPCFTWSARTNEATIYTYHNGSWRGL